MRRSGAATRARERSVAQPPRLARRRVARCGPRVAEIVAFAATGAAPTASRDAVRARHGRQLARARSAAAEHCGTRAPRAGPALHVLDTTDPATILAVSAHDRHPARTLFFVSSKSGTTIEALSLFAYFHELVSERSADARARTSSPSRTQARRCRALAREHGFRTSSSNPGDIGGRYSALSYFGLVPAAVAGVDVATLLDRGIAAAADARGAGERRAAARRGARRAGAGRARQVHVRRLAAHRVVRAVGRAADRREHRQRGHGHPAGRRRAARRAGALRRRPLSSCSCGSNGDDNGEQDALVERARCSRASGDRHRSRRRVRPRPRVLPLGVRRRDRRPACSASIRSTSRTCRSRRTTPAACCKEFEATGKLDAPTLSDAGVTLMRARPRAHSIVGGARSCSMRSRTATTSRSRRTSSRRQRADAAVRANPQRRPRRTSRRDDARLRPALPALDRPVAQGRAAEGRVPAGDRRR